jgi:23S rRNA C2498 (ribose-2'-O)-methylase RlmM
MTRTKTKSVKTRKPLNINLEIRNQEQYKALTEAVNFKMLIFDEVVLAIHDAIINKSNEAQILNIINMNYTITINKSDFKQVLENALKFNEQQEDYTKCKEITKLIKKS